MAGRECKPAASARLISECRTAMGAAASANPAAAMLDGEDAGHRSGVSPVFRGVTSKNHLIVRACNAARVSKVPDDDAYQAYVEIINTLASLQQADFGEPVVLSPEAQRYRHEVEEVAIGLLRDNELLPGALRQHASKVPLIVSAGVDIASRVNRRLNGGSGSLDRPIGASLADQRRGSFAGIDRCFADTAQCEPDLGAAAFRVQRHDGGIHLTPNQNAIVANVAARDRAAIDRLAAEHGLLPPASGLRRNAMACVALPTCGLALAESERYLPDLITALDQRLAAHDLAADDIMIRMTGCPNGCARPYIAEIGLVGKGPGRYNLYLGAAFDGSRLSKLYAEDLQHDEIVAKLDPLFGAYARERSAGERFGDFVIRAGYVAATGNGRDFHTNTGPQRAV